MTPDQLDEFLEGNQLSKTQQAELRASSNKTDYYRKAVYWHRKHSANEAQREFYLYLLKNSVVVPASIKDKFLAIHDMMRKALIEFEINEEEEVRPRMRDEYKIFDKECPKLIDELEADIRGRLAA